MRGARFGRRAALIIKVFDLVNVDKIGAVFRACRRYVIIAGLNVSRICAAIHAVPFLNAERGRFSPVCKNAVRQSRRRRIHVEMIPDHGRTVKCHKICARVRFGQKTFKAIFPFLAVVLALDTLGKGNKEDIRHLFAAVIGLSCRGGARSAHEGKLIAAEVNIDGIKVDLLFEIDV